MSISGENHVDFDALLNFPDDYDNNFNSNSPSLSPTPSSKVSFASPVTAAVTTPTMPTTSQTMNGPSHNYDMYPQQTGFVPGAIAHTMAVNQTNDTGYLAFGSLEYLSDDLSPNTDAYNFNASPSQTTMDLDLDSRTDSQQFLPTVNPSNVEHDASSMSSQSSNVGRLWPGAHSRAALAKAQQRQQLIRHQTQQQTTQKPRGKRSQPTDPVVEQKITQLLNSMRAKPASADAEAQSVLNNLPRAKKEDEEMDEDERLLASEEGKKLSSKERRQLRNKVSARAFRSRRKEYITQLETEIANKVTENGDLRVQNRALMEENRRLSDLTRMLLSSSSFSNFLDNLSSNSAGLSQPAPIKVEQTKQQEQAQVPKDVNPYAEQFPSQQQIGMAMIPESALDFPFVSLDNSTFNFQPQVFVVDHLEMPNAIDTSVLSGKGSNFGEQSFASDDEKNDAPIIERPIEETKPSETAREFSMDDDFESDPEFALFHSVPVADSEVPPNGVSNVSLTGVGILGGIESKKAFAHFELVDATEQEANATSAMARVQRISARVEPVVSRLEILTAGL